MTDDVRLRALAMSTELGHVRADAVAVGGEPLLDVVEQLLGPANRHCQRVHEGLLPPSRGVLEEFFQSIMRARLAIIEREDQVRGYADASMP